MRPDLTSRALAVAAFLFVAAVDASARAANPSTAQCLAASDASLNLGNDHKLRAERAQLLVCASSSCPVAIRKECVARAEEVHGQIPTIVFAAKDSSGADLSAVKVSMDGEVLAERLQGTALAVDPGEHTFTFEALGQSSIAKKLLIQEGQKERREAVTFQPVPAPVPVAVASAPVANASGATPRKGGHHGLGAEKVLALVVGGVGLVGVGVGSVFGISAISKKNAANSACPNQCATEDGVTKWNDARSAGNLSTIGFIVGGAGLVGGALLWFTAPSAKRSSTTQVGLGLDGLRLRGTW